MANWADTSYAVEGPKEILDKLKDAIMHPDLHKEEGEGYEGAILRKLGIIRDPNKHYMRGFIKEEPEYDKNGTLRFWGTEAWGATDFNTILEENLPVKVYYEVQEMEDEVYATNDKEGKYFPDKFYVDTCIDGNYEMEYFIDEVSLYLWLARISNGRITNAHQVEKFNSDYEDSDAWDENYVHIYKFAIV